VLDRLLNVAILKEGDDVDIRRIIDDWRRVRSDEPRLRRLARDVGAMIASQRPSTFGEFLVEAGQSIDNELPEFVRGYMCGLLYLVRAYQNAQVARSGDGDAEEIVRRPHSLPALRVLRELTFARPSVLSERLGIDPGQVSRLLRDLRAADLVETWTAEGVDGRSRPHRLTLRGERVVEASAPLQAETRSPEPKEPVIDPTPHAERDRSSTDYHQSEPRAVTVNASVDPFCPVWHS